MTNINEIIDNATKTIVHLDETYFDIKSINGNDLLNTKEMTDIVCDTVQKHHKNATDFNIESRTVFKCKSKDDEDVKIVIFTTIHSSILRNTSTMTLSLNVKGLNHNFTRKFELEI